MLVALWYMIDLEIEKRLWLHHFSNDFNPFFHSCKDRTCCILFNMHCFSFCTVHIGILCFAYYKIGLSEYFVSNSWLGINQVTQDLKFLYLHTLNSDDNFTINYLDLNASWFPRARNFAKSYSCNNEQLHTTKECLP